MDWDNYDPNSYDASTVQEADTAQYTAHQPPVEKATATPETIPVISSDDDG